MKIPKNNSKNIQLCGIGNGLVDIQYKISDELFNSLNLPKSEMRLVAPDEQMELLNKINESSEKFSYNKCCGGSATNTIQSFAEFGGKTAYLTAVGDDENGNFYYSELENSKVKYKQNFIPNLLTGICLVLITPDGERTMLTSLGASKSFSIENLDENLIAQSEWLYLEGYKFSETTGSLVIDKAIEIAKNNETKIAISASDLFIIELFNEQLIRAVKQADLFFCNENEAKLIAKFIKQNNEELANYDCENSDDAMKIVSKICPNIVMTKGKNGSKILFENKIYEFKAFKTDVIDTTGAGDMFAGAFLFGLLNGEKIISLSGNSENIDISELKLTKKLNKIINENVINFAGNLASKSSSLIVSQFGARYSGSFEEIVAATKLIEVNNIF